MSSEDSPFPLPDAVTPPPPPDNRWLQMPVRAFMRPGVVPGSGVRTRPDGPQAGSVDHGDMPYPPPGSIVGGVERSRDALALARLLARAVGARLILVAVYPVAGRSAVVPPVA